MKKILYILIVCFTLVGCETKTRDGVDSEISKIELKHTISTGYEYYSTLYIKKFKFEEHDYIYVESGKYKSGLVHNPECEKCKNIK